ncbi:MAG: hypothetical protein U5R06_02325 [candidate division KSB1 bacterium]|nr:hypothetical protein [candidate division KSB1 bacterium]
MAKVTAPLFSLDASGTIGKAFTFSKWKGRKQLRANPRFAVQPKVFRPDHSADSFQLCCNGMAGNVVRGKR